MQIGDKLIAKELTDLLESCGVKSSFADDGLSELKENLGSGWAINHVAYKPRSRLKLKDEPVFQFVLADRKRPESEHHKLIEIPYGPLIRDFVLENCNQVYYVRSLPYWESRGYGRDRLMLENP